MKEQASRPILFSAPMVRAILAGTKTQTRRVVKPSKDPDFDCQMAPSEIAGDEHADRLCPHGKPGDRLWVRETWAAPHSEDGRPPHAIQCDQMRIHYAASDGRGGLLWRPSIHMPRWASRITLEITSVRVKRLQSISAADAIAEGLSQTEGGAWLPGPCDHPEWAYHQLWNQINGAGSWEKNPWVWVVEFKRVEGGVK